MKETSIGIVMGDITLMDVDAIVNAANGTLLGGGGVDGAIHKAAGPELLEECMTLKGCDTGQAKITKGYNLKAKYIIHTVGPIWSGGHLDENMLLASCYQNCLKLAFDNKMNKIAFPAISTGAYRFPKDLAAMIAVNETRRFLARHKFPSKVLFVAYDESSFNIYTSYLEI